MLQNIRLLLEELYHLHEQVIEIESVILGQAPLVLVIDLGYILIEEVFGCFCKIIWG